MIERPILFSGPMVCAILEGRKTQTRRVKDGPQGRSWSLVQPGTRLWVRETWASGDQFYADHDCDPPRTIAYRADKSARNYLGEPVGAIDLASWNWKLIKWRPSIYMPRSASRLTLQVTDVRVERLQDLSEADARAEGVTTGLPMRPALINGEPGEVVVFDPIKAFQMLWDSLNAKRGYAWATNPWVWVVVFENVDG